MMTRKDFRAIAAIIKEPLEDIRKVKSDPDSEVSRDWLDGRGMMIYELVAMLSYYFEQSNPAFNRHNFYLACGINPKFAGKSSHTNCSYCEAGIAENHQEEVKQ